MPSQIIISSPQIHQPPIPSLSPVRTRSRAVSSRGSPAGAVTEARRHQTVRRAQATTESAAAAASLQDPVANSMWWCRRRRRPQGVPDMGGRARDGGWRRPARGAGREDPGRHQRPRAARGNECLCELVVVVGVQVEDGDRAELARLVDVHVGLPPHPLLHLLPIVPGKHHGARVALAAVPEAAAASPALAPRTRCCPRGSGDAGGGTRGRRRRWRRRSRRRRPAEVVPAQHAAHGPAAQHLA